MIKVMKREAWASPMTLISSFGCWPCTMSASRHSYEEPFIKPTFEKYMSKNMESPWLFDFQDRLSTSDSFNANVNAGISQICKKVSPDFHASLYSFRHSWATIAQNGCGASLGDVDFALNHSTYKMARVYTKIDYSPAWELNEKVIDYIFFSNEDIDNHEDSGKWLIGQNG